MTSQRTFDPWQQEAIAISGGRHLVLAPPGCGKTDILTERVVHAHAHGVAFSDMLCLTFTNRAAKGMAQRIADRTSNPLPDDLFVGNIHRFCSQLLFNYGLVNHNCAILDESDVDNIIQEELCRRMNIKSRTTELLRFQHALLQLSLGMRGNLVLHADLLHAGNVAKLCDVLGIPFDEDGIAAIYSDIDRLFQRYPVLAELPAANLMSLAAAYQRYKRDNDLLDYDDLLVMAYHWLDGGSTAARSSSPDDTPPAPPSFPWIEIDEVQDLNPLQLAIVDRLAKPDATVVYLGDEQQAIFSFIGAKLETLQALKHRCQGHLHFLHTNYRSPRYLLDLQNAFASANLHIPHDLLPSTDNTTPPKPENLCLLNVGDAQLEAYYTARFAQRYAERCPDGRVAVLVSTNHDADEVAQAMTALHISHFKISGTDLFSLPTVRTLLAHLAVLADETVFIAWARLLFGLRLTPSYSAARALMRDMRRIALLPSDLLLYPGSSYLQAFLHAYNSEELVIFDTETTGLDTASDDIIQIAAIRVRQGKAVGKPFNVILETDKELPTTVGGHPNPMLEVYRSSHRHHRAEGLRLFMDFCKGSTLVGHNVEFDYRILAHNLWRDCPDLNLPDLCPRVFDTLKYIRLVRPRLRRYKLGHLLQALHLEGQNSHQADDDIMATLSLLNFCHSAASGMVASQLHFLHDHHELVDRFRSRYADLYLHGRRNTHPCPDETTPRPEATPALVDELHHAYLNLLDKGLADEVEKWPHLLHFLSSDLIDSTRYPSLRQQLERYTTDLFTCKEADMCGNSLEERFVISTIHKAKGLEFDTVIVYRATDGNFPRQHSWTEIQIQEDARLLFVALSRSRRNLCVVYDDHYGNTPHALSPFLEKVRSHFTCYRRTPDGKIVERMR